MGRLLRMISGLLFLEIFTFRLFIDFFMLFYLSLSFLYFFSAYGVLLSVLRQKVGKERAGGDLRRSPPDPHFDGLGGVATPPKNPLSPENVKICFNPFSVFNLLLNHVKMFHLHI